MKRPTAVSRSAAHTLLSAAAATLFGAGIALTQASAEATDAPAAASSAIAAETAARSDRMSRRDRRRAESAAAAVAQTTRTNETTATDATGATEPTETANAAPATAAARPVPSAVASLSEGQIVCRSMKVIGSRIEKKVCGTPEQWAESHEAGQAGAREFFRQMSESSGIVPSQSQSGPQSIGPPR